jgi:hypothetical protein
MVMNSSIYHKVPIMRQPKTWACWYTSLQMVVTYYRKRGMGHNLKDPSGSLSNLVALLRMNLFTYRDL